MAGRAGLDTEARLQTAILHGREHSVGPAPGLALRGTLLHRSSAQEQKSRRGDADEKQRLIIQEHLAAVLRGGGAAGVCVCLCVRVCVSVSVCLSLSVRVLISVARARVG